MFECNKFLCKQGGKFFFLDFASNPKEQRIRYALQKLLAPFWYFMVWGCKAGNIDADVALMDAGFDVSQMVTEKLPPFQWALWLHYYGTAVKPESAHKSARKRFSITNMLLPDLDPRVGEQ